MLLGAGRGELPPGPQPGTREEWEEPCQQQQCYFEIPGQIITDRRGPCIQRRLSVLSTGGGWEHLQEARAL